MQLSFEERLQRIQIAADLLEYAQLMEEMSRNPKILIKNIFRKKEREYNQNKFSEMMFNQLKKHHYYNAVITAFSYMKDEYIDKLNLKNGQAGIDESTLKSIFVNPDDVDMYINHNPGQKNKLLDIEIIKLIRNALNHVENGVLYKYIEEEDAIEINLRNLGVGYKGKQKTFHVKVPISMLMNIIEAIDSNDYTKSKFVYFCDDFDDEIDDYRNKLKENLKVVRVLPNKGENYREIFNEIISTSEDTVAKKIDELKNDNRIKTKEYTYANGGITDIEIDSVYYITKDYEKDWRIDYMYENVKQLNRIKLKQNLPEDAKLKLSGWVSRRHSLPLGIVSLDRYVASILFNEYGLKSWNISFDKVLEKKVRGVKDLKLLTSFEWFMIDPLEKIFAEYENFIRYSFVNFAPIRPENKPYFIEFNGKRYNCTFLRNAFAHGRIGYAKKGDDYLFALYDTANGLNNEVNFDKVEDSFKPQLFTPGELVALSQHFCIEEKKKIDGDIKTVKEIKNKMFSSSLNNFYDVPTISRK